MGSPALSAHNRWYEVCERACLGNGDALRFIAELFRVAKFLDAVVDGEEVPESEARSAMWDALMSVPSNRFFRENESVLRPLIANAFLAWEDSNVLAREDDEGVEIAHHLRYNVNDIAVMVAYLVGGKEWANEVGPELRRVLRDERLVDFFEEMSNGLDA